MASQSQRRKQKNQLIFKYLKSLTPFQSNAISNEILVRLKRQKYGKDDNNGQKSILMNQPQQPRMGQSTIKRKKSVKFMDQITFSGQELSLNKKKTKQMNSIGGQLPTQKQYDSPEDILKDVYELKTSVFNSFKIQQDTKIEQPYLFQRAYQSIIPDNYNHSQPTNRKVIFNNARLKDSQTQTISRAKSVSVISTPVQNKSKVSMKPFNGTKFSDIATNRNSYYNQTNSSYWSTSQVHVAKVCPTRTTSKSKILSEHQNNLMIEIFKQRLSMKMFQK